MVFWKSEEIVQTWMPVVLSYLEVFRTISICRTNGDSDDLPRYATVVSLTPSWKVSTRCGVPVRWCTPHWADIVQKIFHIHFPGFLLVHVGSIPWPPYPLSIMTHFFLWEYVENIIYKSPVALNKLKPGIVAVIESYTKIAGEHLKGNWTPLEHLPCHERCACWSYLPFDGIYYACNKTFLIDALICKQLYFIASCLKIIGYRSLNNNLDLPYIILQVT